MDWLDGIFVVTSIAWLYELWRYRNRDDTKDGRSEHMSFYVVSAVMVIVFASSLGYSILTDARQASLCA